MVGRKLRSLGDLLAVANDDTEALGYVIVSLSTYAMSNKGMSAEQLAELCDDIERYYEAKQERRERAGV